jgi:hypothetical protein
MATRGTPGIQAALKIGLSGSGGFLIQHLAREHVWKSAYGSKRGN